MKKTKIFKLILLIVNILILSSCTTIPSNPSHESKKLLSRPNISLLDNTVKWPIVDGAISYDIYIDEVFYTNVKENKWEINLPSEKFTSHEYKIAVKALSSDPVCNSPLSISVTYRSSNLENISNFSVMSFNDTHGAVFTSSKYSGMDKVQTICNTEFNKDPLIKIANGDMFQGTYLSNQTKGLAMVEVLNAMNIDAFVLGNHEFDWGLDEIARFKDGDQSNGEADFPFLAANIIEKNTSQRLSWTEPYLIKTYGTLKVGIIGLIGELESSINTTYVKDYDFTDPIECTKKYAYELRNIKQCDIVIASIHDYDDAYNNAIAALSEKYHVDAIITGHTHQKINNTLGNNSVKIPVIQSNTKNYTVGSLSFQVDLQNKLTKTPTITHYYPADYASDDAVMMISEKYQHIIKQGEEVITNLNRNMNKNDIAKLVLSKAKDVLNADLTIINSGAIRTTFSKGKLLMENVYEALPFDNEFYLIKMPGSKLKIFLSYAEGYIVTSDIPNIMSNKYYTIAIIDYVYNKPYYNTYFDGFEKSNTNLYLKEIAINALRDFN